LLDGLGLDPSENPQWDRSQWQAMKERFATIFRSRTRDEWEAIFDGADACVAPVLAPPEVADHAHTRTRGVVTTVNGVLQASPAPRFSRTPGELGVPVHPGDDDLADVLASWT
jgi:alpha-methylacyl-CoA racemase